MKQTPPVSKKPMLQNAKLGMHQMRRVPRRIFRPRKGCSGSYEAGEPEKKQEESSEAARRKQGRQADSSEYKQEVD